MKKTIKKTDLDANLQDHEEKIVTIQDLIEAVTRLQETPNQAKVDQIAQVYIHSLIRGILTQS